MAFVYKSERPCLGITKSPFPGPGQYNPDERQPIDVNPVPFLSTAQRTNFNQSLDKSTVPGPGTYIAPVSVQGYNSKTKTLYSAVNPEMPVLLEQKSSATFSSGTIRFPKHKEAEAPGPGTYELPVAINIKSMSQTGTTFSAPSKNKDKYSNEKIVKGHQGVLRAAVPSIPSVIHSYGYTESEVKELTLNNNPLLEIQKFVGPGYYDVPRANDYRHPKGVNWARSKVQRGFNPELAVSTATLGPGAYKPKPRVHLPLYKFKPSAAFSSNSTRTISDKERVRAERKKKQALKKAETNLMENPNPDEDDQSTTPGPGYYYSQSNTTSFKQTFKNPEHQFFGSGGERFDNNAAAKTTVGPGRYNIRKEFSKTIENTSDVKVPFSTNVKRFADHKNDIPGPGTYDGTVKDERRPVANDTNVEKFGVLDTRFKNEFEATPGPGSYHNVKEQAKNKGENGLKTSHMFTSTSKREAIKIDNLDGPAPGSYNVGYYDVGTKVKKIEDEDMELSLKRVPFSSNVDRFKQTAAQIDERDEDVNVMEDSFDEGWNVDGPDRGDLILKARKQPKITSSFSSKTQRSGFISNPKEKSIVPGPGKYNAGGSDDWIKKTYNVNFTAD